MKTTNLLFALSMCFVLFSCSSKEDLQNKSSKEENKHPRRIIEIDENELEYNNDYLTLFGTIHNDGTEYVMQSLVDSGFTYFQYSDEEVEAFILRQSKRYIEGLFPNNEDIHSFNLETFNVLTASGVEHSNYISSTIIDICNILHGQSSLSDKLQDLASLRDHAFVYNEDEKDRFIACAVISTAMASYEYWSTTTFTPATFFDDDVLSMIDFGSLESSRVEDVAYADFVALAEALNVSLMVIENCPAFLNLIGGQYALALIVGCCAAYTIYQSVKSAYEISLTTTLSHINPNMVQYDSSVYLYLNNKHINEPEIFDFEPYANFLYILE